MKNSSIGIVLIAIAIVSVTGVLVNMAFNLVNLDEGATIAFAAVVVVILCIGYLKLDKTSEEQKYTASLSIRSIEGNKDGVIESTMAI